MRPRPGGRGEGLAALKGITGGKPLQCGHDPEAVESTSIRNATPALKPLQCGHDPEAVESEPQRPRPRKQPFASMRPRPGGRGEKVGGVAAMPITASFNAATTRRPWRGQDFSFLPLVQGVASMRPRPGGRGEATTAKPM